MISTLLPNSADAAKGLGALVLLGAVYVGGVMTAAGGGKAPVATLSHQSDLITAYDDLESTAVTAIRYGDASDSTRTECFQAPIWLAGLTSSDAQMLSGGRESEQGIPGEKTAGRRPSDPKPSDSSEALPSAPHEDSLPMSMQISGLPYVITPMIGGRPTLSVGSERVTLSAFDPRDGAGMTYTYDVPQRTWSLTARGMISAGPKAAIGASSLLVEHHAGWGTRGIGSAGQMIITQDGYTAQPAITISLKRTIWSR